MNILIGSLTVFFFALARFNVPPPPSPSLPEGGSKIVGTLRQWLKRTEPISNILPPSRANTTIIKYWLYRITYTLIGLAVYSIIVNIPGSAESIQLAINSAAGGHKIIILEDAGPFALALFVVLLPMFPPFKGADESLRRTLYERAAIDAHQRSLRNRLRKAPFEVNPEILETVRIKLEADGFDRSDITYQENPTTRSIWIKAAVLMEHISHWQANDKYKTAFAVLKDDYSSGERSVDTLDAAYEALKGDAKVCFKALRDHPGDKETLLREQSFRTEIKELLTGIYTLLSRVSLHAYFSECDGIKSMREIGLKVEGRRSGPIPDANDALWFFLLITAVVVALLSTHVGYVRAVMIASIYCLAALTPIVIAAEFPEFARKSTSNKPAICFPIVSGCVAAVLGIIVIILVSSMVVQENGVPSINIVVGWKTYISQSYPWSALVFLVATLIAFRMHTGRYPEISKLKGFARYQEWGNLSDAAIFSVCTVLLMVTFIRPELVYLQPDQFSDRQWGLLIKPAIITFVLGFLAPTWYRGNALRINKRFKKRNKGPTL